MEDSLSVKSNESVATSDEFDFICDKPGTSKTPTLNITNGNLDELKQKLTEVLQEQEVTKDMDVKHIEKETEQVVGQSKFYDYENGEEAGTPTVEISPNIEKQDEMKPELSESDEEGNKFYINIFKFIFFCLILSLC